MNNMQKNRGKEIWGSSEWKENRRKLIEERKNCENCGGTRRLTPAHPKQRNHLDIYTEHYRGKVCPNCSRKRLYYRQTMKPHVICGRCKEPYDEKEESEEIKKRLFEDYVSMKDCVLLCNTCHYNSERDYDLYRKLFEPEQFREEEENAKINREINESIEEEFKNQKPTRYPTKEELAKLYNREEEYYRYYGAHYSVCNVCGKLMHNGDMEAIEEYTEDYSDSATFCFECVKLPNRTELIKDYMIEVEVGYWDKSAEK